MRKTTIPLTHNNYVFIKKIHPNEFKTSIKDPLALSFESIIKHHSYSVENLMKKIDRRKYPEDIDVIYSEKKYQRSSGSKITLETVRLINTMIDRMLKMKFIEYCEEKKKQYPTMMYKDCIIYFCEDYCLSYDSTFFETLKKFEYRERINKAKI